MNLKEFNEAIKEGRIEEAVNSADIIKLIKKVKPEEVSSDAVVSLYAEAAVAPNADEKLKALYQAGFDVHSKNADGKEASEVLEKKINETHYPKNKSGEIKHKKDLSSLSHLKNLDKREAKRVEEEELHKKDTNKKIVFWCVLAAVCIGALVLVGVLTGSFKEDEEASDINTDLIDQAVNGQDTDYSDYFTMNESEDEESFATDAVLEVKDGDTVNIDYTGYVDGEAFDGGSTGGEGTKLTIGSGSYIDNFEEQLIGAHPGDQVEVVVTFPENYGVDNLNGKEATFDVTVNGIYQ